MKIAYVSYFHRRNLPQVRCLVASIRKFDKESDIVCVVADGCFQNALDVLNDETHCVLMSLVEHECREMGLNWGGVRGQRNERDTAWTMQACLPAWMMGTTPARELDGFVYVDSDVCFFQDLRPYIERLPEAAHVALCAHRYPLGKENISAGIYNNGLMWWRNSDKAREIAKAWGLEAIAKWEPHEQKLLDAWPERYGDAVAEFPDGVDTGPWQLRRWSGGTGGCGTFDGVPFFCEKWPNQVNMQSYHFHEFRIDELGKNPVMIKGHHCNRTNYMLHPETISSIYVPYETELSQYV